MNSNQEVIGISHIDLVEHAAFAYINETRPDLEKIMIELSPTYKITHTDSILTHNATEYKKNGIEVIDGDRKHWNTLGLTADEIVEKYEKHPLKFFLHERYSCIKGLFNGKMFKDRNEDMNLLFQKEKPDVFVLGAKHAEYIKEQNPNIKFSYFMLDYKINNFLNKNTIKAADNIYKINPYHPAFKNQYKKSAISFATSSTIATAGALFNIPTVAKIGLIGIGTYTSLLNVENSLNYLRTLKK